jgi:hypothetical protein
VLRSKNAELREKSDQLVALLNEHAKELELLIQPRDLNLDQQKAIGNALRRFAGKFVLIKAYRFDPESVRLEALIEAALKSGHIRTQFISMYSVPWATFPSGLLITGTDKHFIKSLKGTLEQDGSLALTDPKWKPVETIGPGIVELAPVRQPDAEIFIGVKPLGPLAGEHS